jgi:hypothetical protein
MKTSMILTVVALALWALAPGAVAEDRTFGNGALPSFLQIYDVNGDGVLSEEEKQAMRDAREQRREALISQWDADGDGVISEQERLVAQQKLRDRIEQNRIAHFQEADTNDDGFLSFEEYSAIPAVQRLAAQYPDKPALIFDHMDSNDDNLVSQDEFLGQLRRNQDPAQEK